MDQAAFTCYVRTRDYCTSPKHILDMCLAVIKVSVEMGNYVNVSTYVQKAEQIPNVQVTHVTIDDGTASSHVSPPSVCCMPVDNVGTAM